MPFNAPLTAGEITQVRYPTQAFEHYVLVTPNDIVWQAQVNETLSNRVYGAFDWITTLQGDRANVIEGQIILITTSASDFSSPIVRGRVRTVPDGTEVFINETGANIDTTMYVTVIDDFDIMERLPRLVGGEQFKDWDIAYQELPPLVAGLQSAYADFSGSNPVAFSFNPTAAAIESGAAISTWAWDIGDGSFTGGTSSSDQNIQCTFPGESVNEHRWCHLTVTDDNGISSTFHFQVFTVDKNSSSVVLLDSGQLTINASVEDGYNTIISGWDGVGLSEILDQTRVVIAGIDTYDVEGTPAQTPINTNILMVGRFRNEINTTQTDEQASIITDTEFTVEGFATQLGRLPFLPQQILDDDTPTAWGDITDPDPVRIIVYILAYHTTYPNVSSITIEDLSAYIIGDTNLSDTNVLENTEQIADVVKALPVYAPSGETTIQRNANYLSTTDRDALDTIFDFEDEDYTGIPSLSLEYGVQIGRAVTAAIVYDSTNNEVEQNWVARSPAQSVGSAIESTQMVNQVLAADSTEANARSEIRQRIANDLAFVNPRPILNVELMDGFRWCVPTLHQWWTHTITSGLSARQRTYSTSNRWWLQSISYTANPAENSSATIGVFVAETESTNAGIKPTLVPDVNGLQLSFPPLSPGDFFIDDPLVNHPIDNPDLDLPFSGDALTDPFGNMNKDTQTGKDILQVPMFNLSTILTKRISTLGQNYIVTVEGDAQIGLVWTIEFDFTQNDQDFATVTATDDEAGGEYSNGVGWIETLEDIVTFASISRAFGVATTLIFASVTYTLDNSGEWDGNDPTNSINIFPNNDYTDPGRIDLAQQPAASDFSGTNKTIGWDANDPGQSPISVVATDYIVTKIHSGRDFAAQKQGSLEITKMRLKGTGTPPFGVLSGKRGDAFYQNYDSGNAVRYNSGNGLLIDLATPTVGPYDAGHVYKLEIAGTGGFFTFTYVDGNYSDNDPNYLYITIEGDNMGLTP
jgi:hypothetical protein